MWDDDPHPFYLAQFLAFGRLTGGEVPGYDPVRADLLPEEDRARAVLAFRALGAESIAPV